MNNSVIISEFLSFLVLLPKTNFDRGVIVDILQNITSANPSFLSNPLIFYQDPITGILQNNLTGSPIVHLSVCTAIAGTGLFSLYNGAAARLLTWLVPTLLLMTCMQYAPIGWRKFAMVPHLLSDPIDSTWSLLVKVEAWNHCLIMAREIAVGGQVETERNVGLILCCIEELFSSVSRRKGNNSKAQRSDVEVAFAASVPEPIEWVEGEIEHAQTPGVFESESTMNKSTEMTASVTEVKALESCFEIELTNVDCNQVFGFEQTPFCACTHASLDRLYSTTAQSILDSRVNGTRQTVFSICAYIILGIVAAFVPDFGGNPTPSAGKIVTFILLSWLLPTILLTNIVGHFNTSRSCLSVVLRFKTELTQLMKTEDDLFHQCGGVRAKRWIATMNNENWDAYARSLAETGSIYSFILSKQFPSFYKGVTSTSMSDSSRCNLKSTIPSNAGGHGTAAHWQPILLSVLPVSTSFIAGFIVLWSAPTYFSCRHVMIICIFVTWIISFLITNLVPRLSISTKAAFKIIVVKDGILASAILGILISSACGLFNSCFCWSGWWYQRWWTTQPQVQLNPNVQFQRNNKWIYPLVVGLAMGAQLIWFIGMISIGRGVHFMVMKRSEVKLWEIVLGSSKKVRLHDSELGASVSAESIP